MSSLTDRVDELFSQWDGTHTPGCVLAAIKDGEFIYTRGYGMADLERGVPITSELIFDIGSTGKQFTAAVIAILAHQGHLKLDDSLDKYLPELPAYARQITIRQLIHHTSGLRDYLTLLDLRGLPFENIYAEDFLFDLIVRQNGLNFKPGSEYLYSNSGYFLLGTIAKRVTGKHITELIRELMLNPLGMKHTTFNKDYRPIVKHRAMSYEAGEEGGIFINALALSGGFGDGALLTNVEDLLLWDRNFYNNQLNHAQPDLIEQLYCTGQLINGRSIPYAFGLVVDTYNGQRVVKHGGGWAGYRTELMRFPDQHFSVICISNLGNVDPTSLCEKVANIYLEDVFNADEKNTGRALKSSALSIQQLEAFPGIFQGKYLTVEISSKDNALYFSRGLQAERLLPLGKKKFQVENQTLTLSFTGEQNERLRIDDSGERIIKLKRLRSNRFVPPSLDIYAGEYFSHALNIQYTITAEENILKLKRTLFDQPMLLHPFTENTFLCEFGELRFRAENESVKGFTLHADRVLNIKFRKVK